MGGGEDSDLLECHLVRVDKIFPTFRRNIAGSPGSSSPRTPLTQPCPVLEASTLNYQ